MLHDLQWKLVMDVSHCCAYNNYVCAAYKFLKGGGEDPSPTPPYVGKTKQPCGEFAFLVLHAFDDLYLILPDSDV